jgi:predicted permease
LEALLISAAGALGGLLIGHAIVRLLMATAPAGVGLPIASASSVLASRVLVASAALAALATLLSGVWPAFRASRVDPIGGLRSDLPAGAARLFSARGTLVALQVCVATVLLIGVGALLRSLWAVAQIEPGVEPDRVVLADLDLARGGYDKQRAAVFVAQLEEALTAASGAPAAALSVGAPLEGGPTTTAAIDGARARVDFVMVTPRYFEALGIQLTHGRSIERWDGPAAPPVAVVNQAFARRFWPGAQPMGRHIAGFTPRDALLEVVGVASDVRTHGLRKAAQPVMYVPMAQFYDAFPWQFGLTAMIRTPATSRSGTNLIERTVHAMDPMLPVLRPRSLAAALGEPFAQERLLAILLGAFAALALILAGTGLYGVVSLATAARTREFGVRIAVGALPRHMRRLVHGRSLALAVIGLLAGLAVALAGHRALQPFVFGISTTDPWGLAGALVLVLMVSIVAAEAPARRAMAVDTVQALRHE